MVEPRDSSDGAVLRVHFSGILDLPLSPHSDPFDEEQMGSIVKRALAGVTSEDWASAVMIEGTEIAYADETRPA